MIPLTLSLSKAQEQELQLILSLCSTKLNEPHSGSTSFMLQQRNASNRNGEQLALQLCCFSGCFNEEGRV